MGRLLCAASMLGACLAGSAASLRVTTWRLDFGPALYTNVPPARFADRQIRDAANALRGLSPDVILLSGVASRQRCEQLANHLKPDNYRVAVCSRFDHPLDADGAREVAILTRLPVVAARAEEWRGFAADNPRGGFACGVIRQQTNTYYCYVAQMPGDPANELDAGAAALSQRARCARLLLAHAARLENQYPNRHVATVFAGDFHSDWDATNATPVAGQLAAHGFHSVFQNVAMPRRFDLPPATPDTFQYFDTLLARGADFFSVPQIGGSKLTQHLPVTCDLAMNLAVPPATDAIVRVDWARLGAVLSAPYHVLPPAGRQAVKWGAPALLIGAAGIWLVRRRRRWARGMMAVAMARPVVAEQAVPQIEYPRPAGDTVFVAQSVDVQASTEAGGACPSPGASDALHWQMRALEAEERARQAQAALRSTAMPVMWRMMRDKLLAMLGAQRAQLLDSHESGTRQVLELEQRLEQIHAQFQETLRTRDRRIAELQEQLAAREQVLREVADGAPGTPRRPVND